MTTTLNTQTTEVHPVGLAGEGRPAESESLQVAKDISALFLAKNAIRATSQIRDLVRPSDISRVLEPEKFDFFVNGIAATGALYSGHFELLSGLHSEYFLMFSRLAAEQIYRDAICAVLADRFMTLRADAVMGPVSAGGLLVGKLAEDLKVSAGYFDLDSKARPAAIRLGSEIVHGARVVLVNDMATTAAGIESMVDLVSYCGAQVVGIGLFATRGNHAAAAVRRLSSAIRAQAEVLVHLNIETRPQGMCSACANSQAIPYRSCMLNS